MERKEYFIKREQDEAKGDIKIIKRDFYDDLPRAVCEVLDRISWRWRNYDWFDEAWNKYRDHVINANANGSAIKAPGFIFDSYIDDQVKEDFLNRQELEFMHSDLDLDELYHHGVKGQKWGIRRYQNPDGSLTEEGKQRYGADANGNMSKEGNKRFQQDRKEAVKEAAKERAERYKQSDAQKLGKVGRHQVDVLIKEKYGDVTYSDLRSQDHARNRAKVGAGILGGLTAYVGLNVAVVMAAKKILS